MRFTSAPATSRWRTGKLTDVLTVVRGVSYKKEDASIEPSPGLVPILRATNIQNGLVLQDFIHVPRRYVSDEQLLRRGDIVVAASSGSRSVVGKAAQLTIDWAGSFGAFCFGLRPKPNVNPAYLAWFLQTSEYRRQVSELSAGVNINNLRAVHIENIPIPLAPDDEQERIVAEIEKQLTRLDAGVAALRRVQANLKRYRAAVLKAACEGHVVPTEAELARKEGRTFETGAALIARILAERRSKWQGKGKYREPGSPTTNLAPLPDGWTWACVEQLGEVQLGRQRSPKNVSKEYPTKYIRAANITERGLDLSDVLEMEFSPAERERFALRSGDVVLSEASGSPSQVGKPAIWRNELPLYCFQNTVLRLRPTAVDPKYVLVTFQHFYANSIFAKVAGGVGINHLGAEKFSAIPFPLPPLAEQARIVAEVERRLSVAEELQGSVSTNLQRATRLRQSVLQAAFSPARNEVA